MGKLQMSVLLRKVKNGKDGETGNGIRGITEYYALSTSNTSVTGSWGTSVPTMTVTNKYLWKKETIYYTNGTSVTTAPHVIGVYGNTGKDGVTFYFEPGTMTFDIDGKSASNGYISVNGTASAKVRIGTGVHGATVSISSTSNCSAGTYNSTAVKITGIAVKETISYQYYASENDSSTTTGTRYIPQQTGWVEANMSYGAYSATVRLNFTVNFATAYSDFYHNDSYFISHYVKSWTDGDGTIQTAQSIIGQTAEKLEAYCKNSELKSAGITIDGTNLSITMQADDFTLKDRNDNQVLHANTDGLHVTGIITATSGSFTGEVKATSGTFDNGTFTNMTAASGKIAGFSISGNGLTNAGLDNDAYIIFRNDTYGTFAGIGGNVYPSETAARCVARFENRKKGNISWGTYANVAISAGAQNSYENYAINLTGGWTAGLCLKTQVVSSTTTLTRGAHVIACTNTAEITITLPTMQTYDDGYVLYIKNLNGSKVNIKPSQSYHYSTIGAYSTTVNLYGSYIHYDQGSVARYGKSETVACESNGDAFMLVYVRDVTLTKDSVTYKGAWIQFKHPRDW